MGLFSRKRTPIPPYDTLEAEQRYALYFLLEYLTTRGTIPLHEMSFALQYLEKAAIYFGSVRKAGCIHAHSFISLKRKKGMSETPLN